MLISPFAHFSICFSLKPFRVYSKHLPKIYLFFSYLLIGTIALFYVFGTVGFVSAFLFLRYIYSSLNFD